MAENQGKGEREVELLGMPPASEPHSDFPLPGSWAQAWPIILWGMLALAFCFVIADSLAALVSDPLTRAGAAFVALLCLTTMVIYRNWLLERFRNPSGGLVAGVICSVLLVLALSPFVAEKRWPFAAWSQNIPVAEAEKATLIEWLQEAQRERDRSTPSALVESLQSALASTRKTLEDTRGERDQIKQQLVDANISGTHPDPPNLWGLLNLLWPSEDLMENMKASETSLLITSSSASQQVADYISMTFQAAMADMRIRDRNFSPPVMERLPDTSDLDAPKIPASEVNAIVVHGEDDVPDKIVNILEQCFIVKKTHKISDDIVNYYRYKYKRNVIVIEVGVGNLWKEHSICRG